MMIQIVLFAVAFLVQDPQVSTGKVLGLTDTSVTIRTDEGKELSFFAPMVRHEDGKLGFDERVLHQLGSLKKGDRVFVGWIEGNDLAYITGIEKADGERPRERREREEPKEEERAQIIDGKFIRLAEEGEYLLLRQEGEKMAFRLPGERDGRRFIVRKDINKVLKTLREGYWIGIGYDRDGKDRVVRWIFLIKGGKVDKRDVWERETRDHKREQKEKDREGEPRGDREKEGGRHEEEGKEREGEPEEFQEVLVGFSGQVRGIVRSKRDRNVFTFHVGRILNVWKDNESEDPEAILRGTIKIGPGWEKNRRGKWHPVEAHVRFIRSLEVGQEVTLEIRHAEHDVFSILELSEDQR